MAKKTTECKHNHFYADVRVARITEKEEDEGKSDAEIKIFVADVQIRCVDCNVEFQFIGVEGGFNFNYPTTNIEATRINLPMIPVNKPKVFRPGKYLN